MIVFDLRCDDCTHVFEGWFASSTAYEDQQKRGFVGCPLCGRSAVSKAPMSPRVPAKSNQQSANQQPSKASSDRQQSRSPEVPHGYDVPIDMAHGNEGAVEKLQQLTEQLAKAQSDMLKSSEWVGSKFADEARAMHYGETESRSIHGEVNMADAKALAEEGVKASPLPFPVIPPKLQN